MFTARGGIVVGMCVVYASANFTGGSITQTQADT